MLLASLTAAALLVTLPALAQPDFMASIPNGNTNSCGTCHSTPVPAAEWNTFGTDIKDTLVDGKPDWASVCDIDSDGDGATNGAELGDAACTWVMGEADPTGEVFHPGDETSTPPAGDAPDDGNDGSTDDTGGTDGGDGSTDEGSDGSTDEGEEPSANDAGEGSGDSSAAAGDTEGEASSDDGGCQGGHSTPLSLAAMGLCLAILMRRRVA